MGFSPLFLRQLVMNYRTSTSMRPILLTPPKQRKKRERAHSLNLSQAARQKDPGFGSALSGEDGHHRGWWMLGAAVGRSSDNLTEPTQKGVLGCQNRPKQLVIVLDGAGWGAYPHLSQGFLGLRFLTGVDTICLGMGYKLQAVEILMTMVYCLMISFFIIIGPGRRHQMFDFVRLGTNGPSVRFAYSSKGWPWIRCVRSLIT